MPRYATPFDTPDAIAAMFRYYATPPRCYARRRHDSAMYAVTLDITLRHFRLFTLCRRFYAIILCLYAYAYFLRVYYAPMFIFHILAYAGFTPSFATPHFHLMLFFAAAFG